MSLSRLLVDGVVMVTDGVPSLHSNAETLHQERE